MSSHLSLIIQQGMRCEFVAMWNTCMKGMTSTTPRTRKFLGGAVLLLCLLAGMKRIKLRSRSSNVLDYKFASFAGRPSQDMPPVSNSVKGMSVESSVKDTTVESSVKDTTVESSVKDTTVESSVKDTAGESSVKEANAPATATGVALVDTDVYDTPEAVENFTLDSRGPVNLSPAAYKFGGVCMTFNSHNTLEKTERGLVWFDKSYDHPKRCVPCSNPLISFKWEDPSYRDYWGELKGTWEKEGGLLQHERVGKHGCGMMWVHKITVKNVKDYNSCMSKHTIEIFDRGQVQKPSKATRVEYHHGTTLVLNWYHRNIGHQLFDSLTSLMPLLHDLLHYQATKTKDRDSGPPKLPYESVIAHQLPNCDDSFYICNLLRRLGAFEGVKLITNIDQNTMHCFENLIVPRSGYYGRSHGMRKVPSFKEFRMALFNAYEMSVSNAVPLPMDQSQGRKPRALFYRHASTGRRVWLDAQPTMDAFEAVFDVTDVYDFGKLTLKEQAESFKRADLLLMAHGAQFANVIFCSEGAAVFELSCKGYSHVATSLPPADYGVFHKSWKIPKCSMEGVTSGDLLDANFTLPINPLLKELVNVKVISQDGADKILEKFRADENLKAAAAAEKREATSAEPVEKSNEYEEPEIDKYGKKSDKPDSSYYEKERWHGRFNMQHAHLTNVTCSDLPKIVPRYGAYRRAAIRIRDWEEAEKGKPKILCWAFTRTGFEKRAAALRETWGQRCDKLLFVSNAHMDTLKTLVIKLEDDSHNNLWEKLKLSIVAIQKKFGDEFDWFYKIDDDTFTFVGNLRKLLLSDKVQSVVREGKGAYVGRSMDSNEYMKPLKGCKFNVGGSGYLLDKIALERLSKVIMTCYPTRKTSADDLMMGCCLEEKLNILPIDTRGPNGGERFHPFDPQFCSDYTLPTDKAKALKKDWFYSYSLKPIREKIDHCAKDTVAFHHLPPHYVYHMHMLWYDCPELLGPKV
ncbi:hypothetical protein AAMO2058_000336300 [Amorphochlora amoebiformis]